MYQHAVRLDQRGILRGEIVGDSDVAEAERFRAEVVAIVAEHSGRVLDAIVELGRAGSPSVGAQQVFAELMAHPSIGKVAFVGASALPKLYGQVVAKYARKEAVRFFDTEAEAHAWLGEGA